MGAARPRKLKPAMAVLVGLMAMATVFALSFSRPSHHSATVVYRAAPVVVAIKGKVVKLDVRDGDIVQKGQLVAELDSSGYEADLKKLEAQMLQVQGQGQNAIQPMEGVPGISGILPVQPRMPAFTPVAPPDPVKPKPETKAAEKAAPVGNSDYQMALDKQQSARNSLDKSSQALAKASSDLADAQKSRDALRVKVTQADVAASQAARKADGAKELLDAGVISTKRSEELAAEKVSTQKTLEDLRTQVTAADQAIADAQSRQQVAQVALDKATLALKACDDALTEASQAPEPSRAAGSSVAAVSSMHDRDGHENHARDAHATKVAPSSAHDRDGHENHGRDAHATRMRVRVEEAPPIPVKVFVDQKAMQNSQQQIQTLQKQIDQLKARIAECQVVAPVAGRVSISASGELSIQPL